METLPQKPELDPSTMIDRGETQNFGAQRPQGTLPPSARVADPPMRNAPSNVTGQIPGKRKLGNAGLRLPVNGRTGISARAWGIANYRRAILFCIRRMLACLQVPVATALKVAGISSPTYSRWSRAYVKHGVRGLAPHYDRSGRKPGAGRVQGNGIDAVTIPLMILPQRRNGRLMLGVKLGQASKKARRKTNA